MPSYTLPTFPQRPAAEAGVAYTVASGDLRLSANVMGWPTQQRLEADLQLAVQALGWQVRRGHPVDKEKSHGFIDSQRAGIEVVAYPFHCRVPDDHGMPTRGLHYPGSYGELGVVPR